MDVLYLHQHFATRQGAGGTRSYEFARRLVDGGHRVTMVTGRRRGQGTSGRTHEVVDGIDVLNLGGYYENHMRTTARMAQFWSYAVRASRLRKLPYRPDVVVASSTPLTVGIPGRRLARRLGVPFVFEVRDLWPQAPIELGVLRDPISKRAARRLERGLYRDADHIVALSPGMVDGVVATGVDPDKVTCIPNASDTELFTPERRDRSLLEPWDLSDRFVAVHAGAMGRANHLRYLVDAAEILAGRGRTDIAFLLIGDGGTRAPLEARCAELGLSNVTFAGSIPREKVGGIVASCDVSITSFANLPVLATNSPNKLFDGLAAGVPNIVNAPGWTRELVEHADAGAFVDPDHPAQLADAMCRLADDPELRARQGAHARQLALERFDRDLLFAQFEGVLAKVLGREPAHTPQGD